MMQRGSSFVELLASMFFVSILMAMSYTFARAALMATRVQEAKSEAQTATAVALDIMTRELRLAGFSAAARPLIAVPAAGPQEVTVAADFNGDGDTDDSNELITYAFDANKRQLMRATGGSPQPFVRNVAPGGARFAFFDAAGNELAADTLAADERRRIHRIDIALDVEIQNPDPLADTPLVARVSSSVSLRNQ